LIHVSPDSDSKNIVQKWCFEFPSVSTSNFILTPRLGNLMFNIFIKTSCKLMKYTYKDAWPCCCTVHVFGVFLSEVNLQIFLLNHATFLCMSQSRIWNSVVICCGLFVFRESRRGAIFRFIDCHLWLDSMFRRASSRGLRDICISKWSDSIFEFTLENILAYLDFFLQYINRKDLETQEYQPMRFQNIWITTLVIILDFKTQHFFFEIVPIWNQHNSRDIEQFNLTRWTASQCYPRSSANRR
jgi:hypothetical protein